MAVTRVFQTGFELQEHGYDWLSLATHTAAYYPYELSSPTPNTGDACLELVRVSTTNGFISTPIAATSQMRVNIWVYIPTGTTFTTDGFLLLGLFNTAATALSNNSVFALQMNASNFLFTPGNNALLDDSAAYTIVYDQWIPVGIDMYCHNTLGYVRVWYNGVQVMNVSGDTLDSQSVINFLAISSQWNAEGVSAGDSVFLDDLTVWDTTGETVLATAPDYKRYYWMTPNGNGNYSQWVGQDADSVNNYLNVDEIPPDDDTTYNYSGVTTERDSYAMSNVSLGSETPDAVIPVAVARGDGAGSNLHLFLREDSTDDDGASQVIGTGYATIWERFPLDPGSGAWDETAVNATEVGVLVP